MIKFIIGIIVGLYISEFYDYTFSGVLDYFQGVLNGIKKWYSRTLDFSVSIFLKIGWFYTNVWKLVISLFCYWGYNLLMKPSIQEKIIQYRYSEDGDSSINFKNVRRLYPHHKMVRTTDELVDTLRIRHKVKISKEDIKKILEKKLSSFRSLDFTDGKISRYSRYDKETKTWLKCRKVIYGFRFESR